MPSATDFFPSSMTEFMNFERTISPNFGSGRISRFSGRRRRDIGCFLSLQPGPEPVDPLQSSTLMGALSGAYSRVDYLGRLAPYLERDCLRSLTPCVSSTPRST